jgi:hypothetical protein
MFELVFELVFVFDLALVFESVLVLTLVLVLIFGAERVRRLLCAEGIPVPAGAIVTGLEEYIEACALEVRSLII